MLKALW